MIPDQVNKEKPVGLEQIVQIQIRTMHLLSRQEIRIDIELLLHETGDLKGGV